MTRIHLETRIDAPIERVFDLARDIDLHARSMAATGEEAIAGRTSGAIGLGETVTWRARHFGRWWTLTSRITVVEPPTRFADEQASGPFARFEHTHTFESTAGGTRMTDDWEHTAPFGPLGLAGGPARSWRATCAACSRRGTPPSRRRPKRSARARYVTGSGTHGPSAVATATNSGSPSSMSTSHDAIRCGPGRRRERVDDLLAVERGRALPGERVARAGPRSP